MIVTKCNDCPFANISVTRDRIYCACNLQKQLGAYFNATGVFDELFATCPLKEGLISIGLKGYPKIHEVPQN